MLKQIVLVACGTPTNSDMAFEHGTSQLFHVCNFRVHIPVLCTSPTLGVYLLVSLSLGSFWSGKER